METNDERSLIPVPDRSLASPPAAAERILSAMVGETLALVRDSTVEQIDLDALVREAKRIQRRKRMTPEDIQAFELFHQAARAGHREAQFHVSDCYVHGFGIRSDGEMALEWLKKSAHSGCAEAQVELGSFYRGTGSLFYLWGNAVHRFERNYSEAAKWFRAAAEQGHPDGQTRFGVFCGLGIGVAKDVGEAANWYRKAAEQGDMAAQSNLAGCYRDGVGVETDILQAYAWFRLAADGYANAEGLLVIFMRDDNEQKAKDLAETMSSSDLETAQRLYAGIKERYSAKR